ncbi:SRPBCC domain-containing protein [Histidinibacterium aquaticum]|uniref:Activator of Hsp90 ATPase homologue 1/2-like C-terminal domain-containing protein n=1 Tax=Histidinibacterium aquaticum TaxID=2613962 RepID=A0A5J5GQE6_9RHOB|nr:SRPBCC domain-containing protein [Histidinibacterium aquaticum]KAA9010277.1 hypothetical protein F3S47_03235 [Histidinibacterium aquaticum]
MPLKLVTDGNTATVTRRFAAPPERVWDAHTDPRIVQRWMTGYPGWHMSRCESDPRPGGKIHYTWERTEGEASEADITEGFSLTGEYIELERPHRIVHIERMHLPDPTPDNRIETLFEAKDGGTLMTMTMTVPTAEIMEQMLATGMADGMEVSYAKLEAEVLQGA